MNCVAWEIGLRLFSRRGDLQLALDAVPHRVAWLVDSRFQEKSSSIGNVLQIANQGSTVRVRYQKAGQRRVVADATVLGGKELREMLFKLRGGHGIEV